MSLQRQIYLYTRILKSWHSPINNSSDTSHLSLHHFSVPYCSVMAGSKILVISMCVYHNHFKTTWHILFFHKK